jgi:hypothetical protein
VWSPDAKRIAFTRVDARGNADIWLLTVATRESTRLTISPADDSDPSFSPDGQQLAFVSDRSGRPAIWTMPARRGAKATSVSGVKATVDLGPKWGPKAPPGKAAQLRAPTRATVSITCPTSGPYAGTSGPDTINGSDTADDTICGRGGNDTIRGYGGHDTLSGGSDNDTVTGGNSGDPIVSGGSGQDQIYGGYGDDKLFARDSVLDRLYGGLGYDRAQRDPIDVRSSVEGTIA